LNLEAGFPASEIQSCLCAVNRDGDGYTIAPLFVNLTPSLELTNHDGWAPET
jgi:hypothetical protein